MIDFEFDSDRLTAAGKALVDVIVEVISEDRELLSKSYLVDGHTDAHGSPGYNKRLSQRRADTVARALQRAGLPPDRTLARSFGADRSIEGTDPFDDVNRRVEITPVDLR
jgi:outer membrane protein OmpA-like peptidoglycan-associated protein